MSEKQIVGRVKVLLYGGSAENTPAGRPVTSLAQQTEPTPHTIDGAFLSHGAADTVVLPDKALEVLTLAQRTATAHVAAATGHAQKVRADAEARIEQMHRDAQAHVERIRAEAETVLSEAHAAAILRNQDAHAQAADILRKAEMTLANARAEAERIVAGGRDHAEQLRLQAQQRYEDAVGGLSIKRQALQRQIETLEVFNTDYRQQLTSFVQRQMRALWTEQPKITDAVDDKADPAAPAGSSGHSWASAIDSALKGTSLDPSASVGTAPASASPPA